MKNKKGFTFVEVLVVVLILAIVIMISTNIIIKQLRKSKKQAFITEMEQVVKNVGNYSFENNLDDMFYIIKAGSSEDKIVPKKKTTIKVDNEEQEVNLYSGFIVKNENDKVRLQIWNKSLNACAVKSFSDSKVDIDDSITTEEQCISFFDDLTDNNDVSVKSITGENVDYTLKTSCYIFNEDGELDNFNSDECGTVLVIPNKINGTKFKSFSDDFIENVSTDFTALYIIGVEDLEETPSGLLSGNPDFKKLVMMDLPNLTRIRSGIVSSPSITSFYLKNCPNLTTIDYGVLASGETNLENLILEGLPKVTQLGACFQRSPIKKLKIDGFTALTTLTSSAFVGLTGDTDITLSNNPNLTTISNSVFSDSYIKRLEISNNDALTSITNGTINTYDENKHYYIDELLIHDNPNLVNIDNSSFQGYEYKTIKIYNVPSLQNIRYSAFSRIKAELMDLSGTQLTKLDFSGFFNASIDKLILPSTITGFVNGSPTSLNSIVKGSIEFAGDDKCSLINLFRTDNGDGTYTYIVDKDKLPSCP